ncbi:MAG: restriction endonuclease [Candidatus Kryptonium sp.]
MVFDNEKIFEIIKLYNEIVGTIDKKAKSSSKRAYGGIVRAEKGKMVERIGKRIIEIAWSDVLSQSLERINFINSKFKIPIKDDYIAKLKDDELKEYILKNKKDYFYEYKPDITLSIDNQIVMFVECKSYTENAMFKRILVDFYLLKTLYPEAKFVLLQLESQLGGDYSKLKEKVWGSPQTHTLLSYFDVDIEIITLLEGERKVDKPIHKKEHFKPLKEESLKRSIETIAKKLKTWAK